MVALPTQLPQLDLICREQIHTGAEAQKERGGCQPFPSPELAPVMTTTASCKAAPGLRRASIRYNSKTPMLAKTSGTIPPPMTRSMAHNPPVPAPNTPPADRSLKPLVRKSF